MNIFQRWLTALLLLVLAGCGGGGGEAGTPGFGGGGGPTAPVVVVPRAADLVLSLGATSLSNTGSDTVTATATALDANRNVVVGVPVIVSVNSNAIATPAGRVTDAKGQLAASIGIGNDRTNRTITVTATSGAIIKTATLAVQDTGGGTSGAPEDLLLTLSAATIANNGSQQITATATALDAKRNVLPGVGVAISVNSGATAAPSSTTTGANGALTALVGIGGSNTLRTITVTATAAGLPPRTASLQVVNVPPTATPVAADLSLSLSAGTLINSGSVTVLATVTAVDANRNALAGIPVSISVNNNAVATVSGTSSNASGVLTAAVGIGADRSNRSITVTASSGTVTRSATFAVIGATLSASLSRNVNVNSPGNQIEYRLVDANSSPMPGQSISVTAPGLPSASALTDVNGRYTYTYTAPSTPSTLTVVSSAAGDSNSQSIIVTATGTTPNATSVPTSASLTPTPSVVSVNAVGSSNNQVELRALFLGSNNLPVQNVRVRFSLAPANSSDGVVTQASGSVYAYTDSTGVARGTFTPGQRSSPTNGVTVQACWDVGDFNINAACPNTLITSTLTIASEALSVNIRTNNLVKFGAANLTYIKEYVVMVVDAAGQAKPDVQITPSVDLTAYYKGYYRWNGLLWTQRLTLASTENYSWNTAGLAWVRAAPTSQPMCPNEDVNRNGVLESREDLNSNGSIDPRKADVAIKMVGSSRTDANGLAIVQIEYGQNVASWVDFIITVTASGISGTEARALYSGLLYGVGNLPYPVTAVNTETVSPPFVVSPYGRGSENTATTPATPTGVCTDTN